MKHWLRRQHYLLDHALSSLARRPGKHLSLLAVYSAVLFLLASVMLFTQSLRTEAAVLLAEAPEIVLQRLLAGRHAPIPLEYLQRIDGIRGVASTHGRLWGYFYDPAVRANYTLMVPQSHAPEPGTIHIGAGIARTRGLAEGDRFGLRAANGKPYPLRVAALLPSHSELVAADLMLLSEQDFRALFDFPPGQVTDLVLRVRNPREVRKVAEKLSLKLPDCRPILREEILRTYDALFGWRQGIVMVLLTGALLAFVIFAWDRAAGLSAEERREIGVLKALGWDTRDIMRLKLFEGLTLSFAAFAIGYLAAYLHVFYASAALFEPVLKGWAVLYPDFSPTPHVDPLQLATLFLLTVLPYGLATLVPIWRTATIDPDAVMR